MVDAKSSKENMHKVNSELDKQPKVDDQRNVGAKEADELPKISLRRNVLNFVAGI
jgi:hypothetical protein